MKRIVVHESCIQSFQAGLVQSLLKGLERAAQLWSVPDLHGRPWLITRLRLRVRDQELPTLIHWYVDSWTSHANLQSHTWICTSLSITSPRWAFQTSRKTCQVEHVLGGQKFAKVNPNLMKSFQLLRCEPVVRAHLAACWTCHVSNLKHNIKLQDSPQT